MVNIIKDIDLFLEIEKYDVILLASNIYCLIGDGFQRQVSRKYLYVYEGNLRTKYGDISKLGSMMECSKENNPTFTLLYITKGYEKKKKGELNDFLNYDALKTCLLEINSRYKGKKIASTLLGCSSFDGNGDKNKVINLMSEILTDVDVDVYDYHQITKKEIIKKNIEIDLSLKKTDYSKYREVYGKRKKENQQIMKKQREMLDKIII